MDRRDSVTTRPLATKDLEAVARIDEPLRETAGTAVRPGANK